jgi:hypothetical protein
MIWLLMVTVAAWILELLFCGFSLWRHALFFVATAAAFALLSRPGVKKYIRGSTFSQYVGEHLYGVRFDDASKWRLKALAQKGHYVFCCEPHGAACLHMVYGFAAHGERLPEALAERVHVMAHWCYLALPFVNVIYEAYGVVPNTQGVVQRLLARGDSIAVCPSGVPGKCCSVINPPKNVKTITVLRRREKLGFLSMAARNGADLVPVLSVNENNAFNHTDVTSGWFVYGRWLLFPVVDSLELRVGAPIPTLSYKHDDPASMEALADRYYSAVVALGGTDYTVELFERKRATDTK